jgi:signal peptidase II
MSEHGLRGRIAPLALAIAAGVLVLDQITKHWAVSRLKDGDDIDIFWTLRLNYSENNGMAFGRLQSMGPVIAVVAMVIIVVLLVSLRRSPSRAADVAVGLVLGGAVGNLLDRLFRGPGWFRGAVVDFIDFQWFPIFNIADMGITIGGALLVLASWRASAHVPPANVEGEGQP